MQGGRHNKQCINHSPINQLFDAHIDLRSRTISALIVLYHVPTGLSPYGLRASHYLGRSGVTDLRHDRVVIVRFCLACRYMLWPLFKYHMRYFRR